jgi:hypothetical protein
VESQLSEVIGRLVPNAPLLAITAGAGLALFSGTAARIIERFDGSGQRRRSR